MHTKKGFFPLLIIIVLALVAVLGVLYLRDFNRVRSISSGAVTTVAATPYENASATEATGSALRSQVAEKIYLAGDLVKIAGTRYSNGVVPLGDYHYVTDKPKKGYIYLCNARKDNPGSMVNGPWIQGSSWNQFSKSVVDGAVKWPQAKFTMATTATSRTLAGNDLPISHVTGVFPVAASDDAHAYDPNPNSIKAQVEKDTFSIKPVYSETPYCMGGEAGVMLTGVALFNGFDAGLRDAQAHELQDKCSGHPQGAGQYHYHGISSCLSTTTVDTVIGYALDGFPITGSYVTPHTYLTTDDLDECHGITSAVKIDGLLKVTYHYVMTRDFPYSISCFRAKPSRTGPSNPPGATGTPAGQGSGMQYQGQGAALNQDPAIQNGTATPTPPQEAIGACTAKSAGNTCSFTTPRQETIKGICQIIPGGTKACVPAR